MTDNDNIWPDEPSRRKVVMILKPEDIEALRFDEDGPALLLNQDVHILSSQFSNPDPDVQRLIDQGLVKPGAVLVQNPFDKNLYQDKPEAVEQFALAKHLYFSTFCGLLGAREVEIKQVRKKKKRMRNPLRSKEVYLKWVSRAVGSLKSWNRSAADWP